MPTGEPTKQKACAICGKLFLPAKPSSKICNDVHYSSCPICGKQMIWNTRQSVVPCSKECRKEATRRKNQEKYGCDHPMQNKTVQSNHRQAMLAKYGVSSPLQSEEIKQRAISTNREKFGCDWALGNKTVVETSKQTMIEKYGGVGLASDITKAKAQNTCIDKYGVCNPMQSLEIQNKARATNLEKYGCENVMQNKEVAEKSGISRRDSIDKFKENYVQTCLERYGVTNAAILESTKEKIRQSTCTHYGVLNGMQSQQVIDKVISTNMERYNVPFYCMTDECKNAQGNIISRTNKQFAERLGALGLNYKFEHRISNHSYDIILPDCRTLIEIDPSYTHSTIPNHWNSCVTKYYHKDKSKIAVDAGYRCIHIFDWDNVDKILQMLQPKKTVYARKCTIYRLNKITTDTFLNENHLQGACKGQLLSLGLVYEGELVQIMTFGKPRYNKKYSVELLRLATRVDIRVVGGSSRLFSYATSEYGLSNIISYCDLAKFTGEVYEKLGMKLIRTTPPQEIWSKGDRKITANLLRQRGYDQLFGTNYGKGTSNEELMLQSGWLPVYDCGQAVYEYI